MTQTSFPAYSPRDSHSVYSGGEAMKVSHTHPSYNSDAEKLERLKLTHYTCLAAIAALREKTANPKTEKAA